MNEISPSKLYQALNNVAAGQGEAKHALATAGFLHLAKTMWWFQNPMCKPLTRSNILLMGPSGCGKTYLCEELAQLLDVPFKKIDASVLTPEGYVGPSISEALGRWHVDMKRRKVAPHKMASGIVYLDEFDKLLMPRDQSVRNFKDAVLDNLLVTLEATSVDYEIKEGRTSGTIYTGGLLFILSGNFEALREDRKSRSKVMGFKGDPSNDKKVALQEELVRLGVKKEILGRISFYAEVKDLTEAQMFTILKKKANNYYKQYRYLFSEVFLEELRLSDDVLVGLVKEAKALGLGARGLVATLDKYMSTLLFEKRLDLSDYDAILESKRLGD